MILALAVHLKGFGLALRSVSQVSMAASSSATLLNTPRRICWRVISANSRSTRLIQDDDVGVKCSCLHLLGLVGLVVVADRMHVEVLGYGPVDLFQETDEFLGAVAWQTLADVYKYALDLTVGLRRGGCPTKLVVRRHAAGSIFSLANGKASRKVCIGVLPKHQRP